MSLLKKTVIFLAVFTLSFFIVSLKNIVSAQVPAPTVDCSDVRPDLLHPLSDEFHSSRPYQASPCKQEVTEVARFCGSQLLLGDKLSASVATPPKSAANCTPINIVNGNPTAYRCKYSITNKTTFFDVQLSNAQLPILGNTQDVINSQNQQETLDSAQKTSDYVSWYLGGVTSKAEYAPISTDEENIRKLVDFSGPLNKLLPLEIQNNMRAKTISDALASKAGTADIRHNQIIGCTYGIKIPLFNTTILGIPGPCYESGLRSLLPRVEHRISEWKNHLPPEATDPKFKTFQDFWIAYEAWRGKRCLPLTVPETIPIIGTPIPIIGGKTFLFCGEDITRPNYLSNLWANIPLSSTEDREGSISINSSYVSAGADVKISNASVTGTPSVLFFPHTEEVAQLASALQDTFVPQGLAKTGGVTGVAPSPACDLTNVRSNPGDDLFPGKITGSATYDAEFTCDFAANALVQFCNKDVNVGLGVITNTPKVDEIWQRLVAGPTSVFKRIFPKVGQGGAVLSLLDIPAASGVTYSGANLSSAAGQAGKPTELYYPHVGGVSEYFLKGIQTILRPQGFGEQIISGQGGQEQACSNRSTGGIPNLPAATDSCTLSSGSRTIPGVGSVPQIPETMRKIFEAAGQTFNVPPSLILGMMFGEGVFNPGRYDWTDGNIKSWSKECATMPNCSIGVWPSRGLVPFNNELDWNYVKDAVNTVDPNREPNQCNFLDQVFAAAKVLSLASSGDQSFKDARGKPIQCFGIDLNTGKGVANGSCSWAPSDVQTAIKVWENGYLTNACYTATKGCILGSEAARCPSDDSCEKYAQCFPGGSCSSHPYCIWSVYQQK